jgi:site-specific DNA recombinase
LYPIVSHYGGREQGQNRDKFLPEGWQALATATTCYGLFIGFAAVFASRRRPLIYTRYSSDLQSDRSNEDQEREVRLLYHQKGIDASNAYVIHDRAESGTTNDRPGFNEMQRLIAAGLVSEVGVDDQARASRNDDVIGVVKDMVFRGVRFLSRDGVDTNEKGWQTRVRLQGIHNAMSTEDTAHRVRRGMKGRVLDNRSAGDYPYGYTSYFDDPAYAAQYLGRGPKPSKTIAIYEPHAKWVRQIFEWVAAGVSFGQIALRLQQLNAPVGRNVKRWTAKVVSRIVRNKKYLGSEWTWGVTITIRDSKGRKKQVPAPADEVARISRPDLQIIDAELWARAQVQVAHIDSIFGYKEGQKRRGCRVHFTQAYPRNVLFKLLRCGECNGEMHQNMSRELEYRQCKNTGPGPNDCRAKTRVPAEETKRVLTEFAAELLLSIPDWLESAIAAMNDAVRAAQAALPARIAELRNEHSALIQRRGRLFELIETGELQAASAPSGGSSIRQRIDELDRAIAVVVEQIALETQQSESIITMPDEAFIASQIQMLPMILRTDESAAVHLLGQLFDVVYVHRITLPGKQRGYHQLRFRLNAWKIVRAALGERLPGWIETVLCQDDVSSTASSPEFCLNVGGPTRADEATELIVRRRKEGATWDEIKAETGLSRNTIRECYCRYQQNVAGSSGDESDPQDSDGTREPDAA